MAAVELYKLVGSLGYNLRRVRRLLPPAPPRDVVVENLTVALQLLQELADQPLPEFARDGGLPRLVSLASRPVASIVLEDAPVMKSEAVEDENIKYVNEDLGTDIAPVTVVSSVICFGVGQA